MKVARYLGLAEETEYNPSTLPEATFHVDIASASLDTPTDTELIYEGGLQRGVKTHRPGFYSPSGNIVYAFDIATIGYLLKWALGSYTFTEGVDPDQSTHEFYGTDDTILPSFTARVGKDTFEHAFSGCVINSLEITVEDGFCMATAEIQAAKDSKETLKPVTDLLIGEEYPLAFHEVTAELDTSDISCEVKNLTLSINNNMDADAGKGIGTRHPCRIIAGDREVTISKDMYFEDTSALEKLWGGASGPAETGSTEFELILTFDAGTAGTMDLILPRVVYTEVQQQPSGRDEIVQSTSGRAFLNEVTLEDESTVNTEIYALLTNDETEY